MESGKTEAGFAIDWKLKSESALTGLSTYSEMTRQKDLKDSHSNCSKISTCIKEILNSYFWITVNGIALVWSLISDEVRRANFEKDNDDIFFVIAIVILGMFTLELLGNWIAEKYYRYSYWCFIDLIGIISLIPDIGYIWNELIGSRCPDTSKGGAETSYQSISLKFVRICRLFRILKIYKLLMLTIAKKKNKEEFTYADHSSKLGVILADSMNKQIITLIVFLLGILPFFEYDYYEDTSASWNYALVLLNNFVKQDDFGYMFNKYINFHYSDYFSVIFVNVHYEDEDINITKAWEKKDTSPDYLRASEMLCVYYKNSTAILDMRYQTQLEAFLSMIKTLTMCFIMIISVAFLNRDVRDFVITPVEKTIFWIKSISSSPISLRKAESVPKPEYNDEVLNKCCVKVRITSNYETEVLEDTLIQMGKLSALCFGKDETHVISTGMDEKWHLNPQSRGKKFYGIFGVISLESLFEFQPDVFLFLNKIAYIVHHVADQYMCNSILHAGWNFVLIWKIDKKNINEKNGKIEFLPNSTKAKFLADLAFICLLKISSRMITDKGIQKYCNENRIFEEKCKYNNNLGYALNVGCGIEGCMGSDYKIDAGYLSTDLNSCIELSSLSRKYSSQIFASDSIYEMFSPEGKKLMKIIETDGKEDPEYMKIYKTDLKLAVPPLKMKKRKFEKSYKEKKKALKEKFKNMEISGKILYDMNKCIRAMRPDSASL